MGNTFVNTQGITWYTELSVIPKNVLVLPEIKNFNKAWICPIQQLICNKDNRSEKQQTVNLK